MAYPPSTPDAYWKFNAGTGSSAVDSSGNANTLTLQGAATWLTPGRWGAAALDDATTGYALAGNTTVGGYNISNTWSVSIWFKTTSSANYQSLVSKIGASGAGWHFSLDPSGRIVFFFYDGTNYWYAQKNTTNYADDTWHHAVLTNDGSSTYAGVTIYMDGSAVTLASSNSGNPSTITNSVALEVGNNSPNSYHLKGQIDEVLLFPVTLSGGNVTTLYTGPINTIGGNVADGGSPVSGATVVVFDITTNSHLGVYTTDGSGNWSTTATIGDELAVMAFKSSGGNKYRALGHSYVVVT